LRQPFFLVEWKVFFVSGFKFQVSGFRFQVSGFKFQVSSFRFQVSGFKLNVKGKLILKTETLTPIVRLSEVEALLNNQPSTPLRVTKK
jgi:hypothetical protein